MHYYRGLALASNKESRSSSFPSLSWWDGEKKHKNKAELVGCDKYRKGKITTIILIKRIYRVHCSHHLMLSTLLSSNYFSPASFRT